jgi:ParB family transcriptional regulator, chromosome partitioning protein
VLKAVSKSGLGRGLGAILEEVEEAYISNIHASTELIKEVEISDITVNPFQPRTHFDDSLISELSESIKKHGLLQPVLVIKSGDGYMLVAGERRLRAVKLSGANRIKAIVADIDKTKIRELALIENIQRENLNPIELAISLKELIEEYGVTHEEISETIKKSRSFVTNSLRLLNLSASTKENLSVGAITYGHAKVLVGLDEKEQKDLVNTIIGQKLSVRETEELVSKIKKSSPLKKVALTKEAIRLDAKELIKMLENKLNLNITTAKNSLTIKFDSQIQINTLLKAIK